LQGVKNGCSLGVAHRHDGVGVSSFLQQKIDKFRDAIAPSRRLGCGCKVQRKVASADKNCVRTGGMRNKRTETGLTANAISQQVGELSLIVVRMELAAFFQQKFALFDISFLDCNHKRSVAPENNIKTGKGRLGNKMRDYETKKQTKRFSSRNCGFI
jgi:hypothetical protein